MIEVAFFSPDEIKEIIIIYCTPKVEKILADYQKNKIFLCSKDGFEGIFSQETTTEDYYKPLLDLRNAIINSVKDDQKINVTLSDGELIVIGCPSSDKDLSLNQVENVKNILEKIRDTKYSSAEIKQYNSLIEEKIKNYLDLTNKNKKDKPEKKKQIRPIFLFLFIFSCVGLPYGLYNLQQSRIIPKPQYKVDVFALSNFPYQSLDSIYKQGLNDKNKCQDANGNQEKMIQCLKNLESNVFHYKKNITNVQYDQNSQLLKFDCNFAGSPTTKNFIEIQADNYNKEGYRKLDIKLVKVLPIEDAQLFKQRLLKHGNCTYILSGIKDAYTEKKNKFSHKVVIPVKLDLYVWFDDDSSIFYHEEVHNYGNRNN